MFTLSPKDLQCNAMQWGRPIFISLRHWVGIREGSGAIAGVILSLTWIVSVHVNRNKMTSVKRTSHLSPSFECSHQLDQGRPVIQIVVGKSIESGGLRDGQDPFLTAV